MKYVQLLICGIFLTLLACSILNCQTDRNKTPETEKETSEASEDIAELYRDIYERALRENTLDSQETIHDIAKRLGEYGYAAGDTENCNRFDMVCWKQVEEFCQMAKDGQDASVSIFLVMGNGGFLRLDLKSSEGSVTAGRSVLIWKDESPMVSYRNSYPADDWIYTEEGYLFFDESVPEGYDGAPGYTAIRVLPLDPVCRSFNQVYIIPVGYGANNMFLHDWTEKDFASLDFYDLFRILYPSVMNSPVPYGMSSEADILSIPPPGFEAVILSRFAITREDLRAQTDYDPKTDSYLCPTRGFYDAGISPNQPYPEVVAYTENADRTITLIVNAVLPKEHLSQAFSHEVVVRPKKNGSFEYVSNHLIPSTVRTEMWWYIDRQTEERNETEND
ncbi:MAG: DUF6070 family protein [Eubacteriales bacterium]|nr:DUF6070 family protein [Eubacteriales bacterium]